MRLMQQSESWKGWSAVSMFMAAQKLLRYQSEAGASDLLQQE